MELRSLGRFKLVRPLAHEGSSALLYLARGEDEDPNSPPSYVLKILKQGRDEAQAIRRAQFLHEGALLSNFNHPCIPSLHANTAQSGVDYIAMDYVQGVDLAELLGHRAGEAKSLSKELAVYIGGQLADALRHVHECVEVNPEDGSETPLGVLHRDLCPRNILLSVEGDVILSDFGSASSSLLAPEHTTKDAGTVAYKAPERVTGSGEASVRSDLFSLAVVLWEVLRGERCARAEDDLKTMDAIVRFDISHPSKRVSGLSPKLSEVVRRNLDRDLERRYISAFQVLQRLAQAPEAAAAESSRQELGALVRAALEARPKPETSSSGSDGA